MRKTGRVLIVAMGLSMVVAASVGAVPARAENVGTRGHPALLTSCSYTMTRGWRHVSR